MGEEMMPSCGKTPIYLQFYSIMHILQMEPPSKYTAILPIVLATFFSRHIKAHRLARIRNYGIERCHSYGLWWNGHSKR